MVFSPAYAVIAIWATRLPDLTDNAKSPVLESERMALGIRGFQLHSRTDHRRHHLSPSKANIGRVRERLRSGSYALRRDVPVPHGRRVTEPHEV